MSPEVDLLAQKVIKTYRDIGGLAFAYGQGSVFMGFSHDSDLDINLVWDNSFPPRETRPVSLLCDPGHDPIQFDQESLALDKLWVDGRQVDVVHHPKQIFDGWLEQVKSGDGWQEAVWPLPLFAVAAFYYGVLLDDVKGEGAQAHAALVNFPAALVQKTREALAHSFPIYQSELAGCVRRNDGWLFHELLTKLLRNVYIAWFAAEQRYCPHLKWVHAWIERFNMDAEIAGIERELWEAPALSAKLALTEKWVGKVLRLNPTPREK